MGTPGAPEPSVTLPTPGGITPQELLPPLRVPPERGGDSAGGTESNPTGFVPRGSRSLWGAQAQRQINRCLLGEFRGCSSSSRCLEMLLGDEKCAAFFPPCF